MSSTIESLHASEPPASRSRFQKIWLGPDGLRTIWSVLLFMAISMLVLALFAVLAYYTHHLPSKETMRGTMFPAPTIIMECASICAGLVALKVMSLIERRSWLDYGLRSTRSAAHFGQGLFWGVATMLAVVGMLLATHSISITFSGGQPLALLESGLLWAIAFVLVSINEELTFRGYLFFRSLRTTRPMVAAVVMSLWFAVAHLGNPGESLLGLVQVVMFGLLFCLAVWRTGSLWWAFGFHAAWDWSQSFLFGVADSGRLVSAHWFTSHAMGPAWLSGGSVGPEGSVLMFPALALLLLIVIRTLPHTSQPSLA